MLMSYICLYFRCGAELVWGWDGLGCAAGAGGWAGRGGLPLPHPGQQAGAAGAGAEPVPAGQTQPGSHAPHLLCTQPRPSVGRLSPRNNLISRLSNRFVCVSTESWGAELAATMRAGLR